jgi:hypothetical protein
MVACRKIMLAYNLPQALQLELNSSLHMWKCSKEFDVDYDTQCKLIYKFNTHITFWRQFNPNE